MADGIDIGRAIVGEVMGDLILSPSSPLQSARQLILRHHTMQGEGHLRTLHHQNDTYYLWRQSHYIESPPEEMRAAIYQFLDHARVPKEGGVTVAFNPNKSKVANVLEATASEAQLPSTVRPPCWLDMSSNTPASEIIACENGLLHLPTRRLRPHTPAFFTLNALTFGYEPDPDPPANWLNFLKAIWGNDPSAIDALQEVFGLALTGNTSFQKAFLIVGPKRSGKGTIARVLTELIGAANVCSPTLGSISTNFGLSPLIGKRLAVISDARLGGKADQATIAERLLAITGEDAQTIDRKHRDPWTGKLETRFLILTNELPRLTDVSGALASRFIILTMTQSFYGKEDRGLLEALLPELPGILVWAIQGWERLVQRGYFVPPKSSEDAIRQLEDLGSPVGAFIREECAIGPEHAVRCDEIYKAWCEWCEANGREHPGTLQRFGTDLSAAVAGLKRVQHRLEDGRARYYQGIGLSPARFNRGPDAPDQEWGS